VHDLQRPKLNTGDLYFSQLPWTTSTRLLNSPIDYNAFTLFWKGDSQEGGSGTDQDLWFMSYAEGCWGDPAQIPGASPAGSPSTALGPGADSFSLTAVWADKDGQIWFSQNQSGDTTDQTSWTMPALGPTSVTLQRPGVTWLPGQSHYRVDARFSRLDCVFDRNPHGRCIDLVRSGPTLLWPVEHGSRRWRNIMVRFTLPTADSPPTGSITKSLIPSAICGDHLISNRARYSHSRTRSPADCLRPPCCWAATFRSRT
jgi:hypothetical protein